MAFSKGVLGLACLISVLFVPNDADLVLSNGATFHGEKAGAGSAYYGIKYGTAHRFEHAKPNKDFSYLNDPLRPKLGYVCPHFPIVLPDFPIRNLTMGEDCLYLDVYVPSSMNNHTSLRPALFWIYGGGFKS